MTKGPISVHPMVQSKKSGHTLVAFKPKDVFKRTLGEMRTAANRAGRTPRATHAAESVLTGLAKVQLLSSLSTGAEVETLHSKTL